MRTFKSTLKALLLFVLFAAPALVLSSCSDTEDGSYVAPITRYEKIAGVWTLNTVTQVDESNQTTMNLTNQFDFDTFSISLNVDSDGNPTTYNVDGNAPAMIPTSGTWTLKNPFVNADGTASTIVLNGQTELTVTAAPGAQKVLEFKLTRKSNGIAFVSYVYNLVPVSSSADAE